MTMTIARATKESNAAVENIRYPSRFERVIYRDIYAFYLSYYLRNVKIGLSVGRQSDFILAVPHDLLA